MNDLLTDSFEMNRTWKTRDRDIEMGPSTESTSVELEVFFEKVGEINKQIEKLGKLLKKLQDANEKTKSLTNAKSMKNIKQCMERDIDDVGSIARFSKSKLEELDRDNMSNRQKPGCGKGTGVDRSRTATTSALKKKLRDRLSEFQILRETMHQEHRETVERRVYTVTGVKADDEVIDRLIESGDAEQIFQKAIHEQGRSQVMDTLVEIQERHASVKELEKKLVELQQIFLDMGVLVESQGDLLDNIESQVSNAVDHVQSGNTALQTAKKLKRTPESGCALVS